MYKVEKEKNKGLQNEITVLKEEVVQEKQSQEKLEGDLKDIQGRLEKLEKVKRKCQHGKCPICRGDKIVPEVKIEKPSLELSGEKSDPLPSPNQEEEDDIEVQDDNVVEEEDDAGSGEDEGDQDDGGNKNQSKRGKNRGHKKLTGPAMDKKKGREQMRNAAWAIIEKLKEKKLAKFRNFMPMKSVLKQIHALYNERILHAKENSIWREEEFYAFAYKVFSNNFGFRKIAEQKFIVFLLSVKKYLHIVRINLFARFMNLLQGPTNFTVDEFNKYLEGVEFINNSTLGINMAYVETESKFYAPFLRGLEYLKHFCESKISTEEYIDFKKEFESIKENDPKNINRTGIVDVDLFMTKILTKYRVIMSRTKQFVVNAFKAADLDGNKYCSLKEFLTIYRNIEADKYDEGFAEGIFFEHADIKVDGEMNLSFDKFTVVCVEYGLFSDLQQDKFLGIISHLEIDARMLSLKLSWNDHFVSIENKLSELIKTSQEEKEYWVEILQQLNEKISTYDRLEAVEYKPILIAFKILDNEVERLRDSEIERDAYGIKKTSLTVKTDTSERRKESYDVANFNL